MLRTLEGFIFKKKLRTLGLNPQKFKHMLKILENFIFSIKRNKPGYNSLFLQRFHCSLYSLTLFKPAAL